MKIINVDTQVKEMDYVDAYVGSDNVEAGRICGQALMERCPEGGKVLILECPTQNSINDRITGFEARGHSGYAEAGADIVCAAVTSAIRLVEATVNDVLGLAASVKVREQDASISLHLPGGLSPTAESTCQSLLTGLMVYFSALHDEYPDNIEVLEDD